MNRLNNIAISAFPGLGKSWVYDNQPDDLKIYDSDSSMFDKKHFPQNYIKHIKSRLSDESIVLVSSHENVREEMSKQGVPFILVYPDISLKDAYLRRYEERGSPPEFVDMMDDNWEKFVDSCQNNSHTKYTACIQDANVYLYDVLGMIDPETFPAL